MFLSNEILVSGRELFPATLADLLEHLRPIMAAKLDKLPLVPVLIDDPEVKAWVA
tara:strand:- start:102 stop:266 length:165 start_codon:yes stop_codon:yes gene_type:complete